MNNVSLETNEPALIENVLPRTKRFPEIVVSRKTKRFCEIVTLPVTVPPLLASNELLARTNAALAYCPVAF